MNPEMRSFWIIWVDLKSNDKSPYKRYTKEKVRREGGNIKTEAETGGRWPQAIEPRHVDSYWKLEEAKNGSSP